MSDVNATDGAVEATEEAVQPQAEAETQPSSAEVESAAAEEQATSLNEAETDSKPVEYYEEELKKRNAENKRRREKQKELQAENERLTKRLEELQNSVPTLDDVGGDYDLLQLRQQEYIAKKAALEVRKEDSEFALQEYVDPVQEQYKAALDQANEKYLGKLQGYFEGGGKVAPETFKQKVAVVNEALVARSPSEQAILIDIISQVDTAEAMLNLADDAALRYQIANGSVIEAIDAIRKAEVKPRKVSNAPSPVPDVEGAGGIPPNKDPSQMSMSEYNAWKAKQKSRT